MRKTAFVLVAVFVASSLLTQVGQAGVIYNFECITTNDPSGNACLLGESAFYVTVSEVADPEQVLFTFGVQPGFNDPYDSYFIDGVYFYDGVLLDKGIVDLLDADDSADPDGDGIFEFGDADVDFSQPATPDHLPGFDPADYDSLVFGSIADLADADPSPAFNGVHAGETLGVLFDLVDGKIYQDVINGINTGQIIIGVKSQGFGNYSESFTTTTIPAPGAVVLGSIGIAFVGWLRRRRVL